jgi:uncharacterized protein (DUF1499 family)
MPNWAEIALVLIGGGFLSLKLMAVWSHSRCAAHGLINGKLAPNNLSPNSVCSDCEDANIKPIAANGIDSWENLQDAVESLSGSFITIEHNYMHAVFRTPTIGFEADFEARLDTEAQLIHIRSSARVGFSDNGSNRKRVDKLRSILE